MTHTPDMRARSPWSPLHGLQRAQIQAANKPLHGELRVPGSKSYTNRALIIAALARGPSTLRGILRSDDSYWCIETLKSLGVETHVDGDTVSLHGCDGIWPQARPNIMQPLFIGSAGTAARFLPGALAASSGGPWIVDGSSQMRRRPVGALVDALRGLGATIDYVDGNAGLPLKIEGGGLDGGRVTMSGSVSSQFISGVLIASPYAALPTQIDISDHIVQHAYVMMTIDMMADFGVTVEHDPELTHMRVEPQRYVGHAVDLEADASTAGYFFALAALTGGRMRVSNLTYKTRQPDVKWVDVLERMGARVQRTDHDLTVEGPQRLQGGFTISMKEMSDQTLTLAAVAPFADGPITITDVAHIRHHESDRIAAMCEVLRTLGVKVDERPDGMTIHPSVPHAGTVSSHDDHRIAMSASLMGAKVGGVEITDPGCVSKTCPTFFEELSKVGVTCVLS